MKVDHHKFLLCMNVMVYDIPFKQRTVHICFSKEFIHCMFDDIILTDYLSFNVN